MTSSLSAITGTPVRVEKIRVGRTTAGLRPQHVSSLHLIKQLSSGRMGGSESGFSGFEVPESFGADSFGDQG